MTGLDYRLPPTKPEPCSKDKDLGVMVHRYDMGARVCRCGKESSVDPNEGPYSWRTTFGKGFQNNGRDADDDDDEGADKTS